MTMKKEIFPSIKFEHKKQAPISALEFRHRLLSHLLFSSSVVTIALGIGMIGYHCLETMSWLDAFLNASMILGGMGPVSPLNTDLGKLFAGLYALFAGLVFLIVAGLMFGPLLHRLLHLFHYEAERDLDEDRQT